MKQETYDLVEAVRALGIELTDAPVPRCLRITSDADTFWERLIAVRKALDAFDRAGGASKDVDAPKPPEDAMKAALAALLRLYEAQGGNMDQAADLIREKIGGGKAGGEVGKKKDGPVPIPTFAPGSIKKKKHYKPRINLIPDMPGKVSLAGLQRLNLDVQYVEAISGATLASDKRSPASPSAVFGRT